MLISENDIVETIKESLIEMAYPSSFSMDEFKSISSFSGRVRYCDERLVKLGSGSSRTVYRVDDEKVLKLAKNSKGIYQNEYEASNGGYLSNAGIGARLFDCDYDNYMFVEMELARKCKPSDFKRITGYDFKFICSFIDYVHTWYTRYMYFNGYDKSYEEQFRQIAEDPYSVNDVFGGLIDYLTNYQLETIGDLKRLSSWGVVKRDGEDALVIIDYGLSDEIFNNYYRRR